MSLPLAGVHCAPGDRLREDYPVYLEPILARACSEMAVKLKLRTRSRYLRRATVLALLHDGYPLNAVTDKFRNVKLIDNRLTACR